MSSMLAPPSAVLRRRPGTSLRTYMVAVILISTVPLALLLSYQIYDGIRLQQRRVSADLVRSAGLVGQIVHRELRLSADALLALPPEAADDPASLRAALRDLQREHPSWQAAFAVTADGTPLVDSTDPSGRAEPAAARWMPPPGTTTSPKGMRVSASSTGTRDSVPVTMVAVPLPASGPTKAWVGAWISAATWQRVLDETVAPGNGFLALVDGDNRIIARTLDPAVRVGKSLDISAAQTLGGPASGAAGALTFEGREMIVRWQHIEGGWRAAAVLHANEIDAGARQAIVAASVTAGACLLLGLTLGLAFTRRLVTPLDQLASGDAGIVPKGSSIREIDRLRDRLLASRAQEEATRRQLEAKVAEFQAVFDNSPVGLAFAHDSQCRVVVHNAAMTALLGPPWPGQTSRKISHEGRPLRADHFPLYRAASRGEVIPPMELAISVAGEPETVVLASAVPLRDARGWPRGAILAAIDITQRKEYERRLVAADDRLRDNQHLIDLIQEAGQVGFFHYRFDGDRWTSSPGQSRLFDPPDALTTMTDWLRCIAPAHQVRLGCELAAVFARRQDKATLEYQVHRRDGERRWMSSRVLLDYHPDGRPMRMLGVTVDIDEHMLLESERNASMRREQQARRDAEAASRAKDEFLAMLGHELRNPLGAISSAIEVLQYAGRDSALGAKAIQIIGRQSGNLARILDDLLDVARVISGKVVLTRQRFDLAEMVARAVSTVQFTGQKTHDIVEHLTPTWVDADPTRIEQVLNNLLGNAFRYTPPGRPVEVHVFRDGPDAVLQVRDHGTGIPAPLLDRVFDLFVQGEQSLDRRGGGLGIGLTLVRQLLTLHGGSVTASSSEQGSTFEARLPAEDEAVVPDSASARGPADEPARCRPDATAPARSVVLVEDNADALHALRLLLELEGHAVRIAVDGTAGLATILAQEPDVAIVDLGLPGLDGFGVVRQARAAGHRGLMIAMSGYGQAQDVRDALAAGFDAHLVKPISAERLRVLMALGAPAIQAVHA